MFITGCCIGSITILLDRFFNRTLSINKPSNVDDKGHKTFGLKDWQYTLVIAAIGFVVGLMICRTIIMAHLVNRQHGKMSCGFKT
jgi:hypothetical protein